MNTRGRSRCATLRSNGGSICWTISTRSLRSVWIERTAAGGRYTQRRFAGRSESTISGSGVQDSQPVSAMNALGNVPSSAPARHEKESTGGQHKRGWLGYDLEAEYDAVEIGA